MPAEFWLAFLFFLYVIGFFVLAYAVSRLLSKETEND